MREIERQRERDCMYIIIVVVVDINAIKCLFL